MKPGLTTKIILLCLSVTVIVLAIGFFVISRHQARSLRAMMDENSFRATRLIQTQFRDIFADIDNSRRQIQALADSFAGLKDVVFVEVYDQYGTIVARGQRPAGAVPPVDPRNAEFAHRILRDPSPLTMSHPAEKRFESFVPVLHPDPNCGVPVLAVVNLAVALSTPEDERRIDAHAQQLANIVGLSLSQHFTNLHDKQIYLADLVREFSATEGVDHVEIIGKDGVIIGHSDPNRVGALVNEKDRSAYSGVFDSGEIRDSRDPETGALSRFVPILKDDPSGRPLVQAVAEVETDPAVAARKVRLLQHQMAFTIAVLALVLTTVLVIFLRRFLWFPIHRLSQHAGAVASGDFSHALEISQRDELGDLARSFDAMVEKLGHSLNALAREKNYSENVLTSLQEALLVVSPDGTIQIANKAAARLLDYRLEELIGLPANRVIADEAVGGGTQQESDLGFAENTYIRKDGTRIPVSFSASIIRGSSATENLGIVCVANDIRELKKALAALKESEDRFRKLYEGVPLAYLSTDKHGAILDVNDAWERLFRCTRAEAIGRHLADLLHPDSRASFRDHGKHLPTDDMTPALEVTAMRTDGSTMILSVTGKASRDYRGFLAQNHFIFTDITERKGLEEAIIRGKEDWEQTFDAITDLITIHDTDCNITRSNRAAKDALKIDWKTGFQAKCYDVFGSSVCRTDDCPGNETLRSGKPSLREASLPGSDGVFEIQTIPRFDDEGRVLAIIHVARDITERKRNEQILRDIAEGVSRDTGEAFLHSLLTYMLKTLGLDIGLIGEIDTVDTNLVRTVSVNIDGQTVDNFEYNLTGTPCSNVLDGKLCSFPDRVTELFPDDQMIREIGAQGYIGTPLFDSAGRALGIMVGMARAPVPNITRLGPLLQIFAVRASTELERKQVEDELFQRQAALQSVYTMATTMGGTMAEVFEETAATLSRALEIERIFVLMRHGSDLEVVSYAVEGVSQEIGDLTHHTRFAAAEFPWKNETFQDVGYLCGKYPYHTVIQLTTPRSLLSVPVLGTEGDLAGLIFALHGSERTFRVVEIQLVEIFSKYISFRLERDAMENALREAQRMEVIGKVAGGVAHEVRNPLNAIMAITDAFAKDLGENPDYAVFIGHMRNQVSRLAALMTDLLDLGKPLDESKLRPESLSAICEAALAQWRHSALSRNHAVVYEDTADGKDISVNADQKRIQQVILNLIENAAQHSPDGSPILLTVEPGRRSVTLSVADRGSGIPHDILPKVFEAFFTMRRGGTGLGLSIVKKIVDLHRGEIAIANNDPPPGCTARVVLPRAGEG